MPNGKAIVYNGQVIGTPSGVCAIDNLVAENIKSGVNIGGVVGNYTGATPKLYRIKTSAIGFTSSYLSIQNVPSAPKYINVSLIANHLSNVVLIARSKDYDSNVIEFVWKNSNNYDFTFEGMFTYNDQTKVLQLNTGDSSHQFYGGDGYYVDILYYEN